MGFNIFKRSIKISIILILCNILILGTIPPGSALDISYNLFYDKNGNLGSGFGLNYTYFIYIYIIQVYFIIISSMQKIMLPYLDYY